jgi:hypothetical protein
MLCSSLPVDGCFCLADFLKLPNASTSNCTYERDHVNTTKPVIKTVADGNINPASVTANDILSLSSLCETELVRAEYQTILAERLLKSTRQVNFNRGDITDEPKPTFHAPVSPPSASSQFRDAMHAALMKVMEERDEAHARMVSAEVLHVHEMDQQRKKSAHLSTQLETMKKREESKGTKFRDEKEKREAETLRTYESSLQHDADAELLSLCQQLAGEISARTSASLEVIRLKENRKIEQKHEEAEKKALRDVVIQLKQQLAEQRKKAELARQESGSWRESFEEVVQIREVRMPGSSAACERAEKL